MYIVIFVSLVAVLFTWLESQGKMRNGMLWGFILVTFLACIHYRYGSDYMEYYYLFEQISSQTFSWDNLWADVIYREPGWALLCYLFSNLGSFFVMVAVLNIVQNVLIYKFIKRYAPKSWWSMGVFIYLFITSNYLMAFSMMRQSFVMAVFLGLWPWISERKWLPSLAVLLVCSTVHVSSLILLPFAFWGFLPVKKTKVLAIVFGVLFVALMVSDKFLNSVFERFMAIEEFSDFVSTYENDDIKVHFGLGFVILMIPFFLLLYSLMKNKEFSDSDRRLIIMAGISTLIIPFSQIIQLTGRMGLYFGYYQMAAYPLVYRYVKQGNRLAGQVVLALYIFITLVDYWRFFQSEIYGPSYQTFHTIFEVLW